MPRSKNSTSTSHCPGKGRQGETSLERDDTSCTDDIVVSRWLINCEGLPSFLSMMNVAEGEMEPRTHRPSLACRTGPPSKRTLDINTPHTVPFSSSWYIRAGASPYALYPVSLSLFPTSLPKNVPKKLVWSTMDLICDRLSRKIVQGFFLRLCSPGDNYMPRCMASSFSTPQICLLYSQLQIHRVLAKPSAANITSPVRSIYPSIHLSIYICLSIYL